MGTVQLSFYQHAKHGLSVLYHTSNLSLDLGTAVIVGPMDALYGVSNGEANLFDSFLLKPCAFCIDPSVNVAEGGIMLYNKINIKLV